MDTPSPSSDGSSASAYGAFTMVDIEVLLAHKCSIRRNAAVVYRECRFSLGRNVISHWYARVSLRAALACRKFLKEHLSKETIQSIVRYLLPEFMIKRNNDLAV